MSLNLVLTNLVCRPITTLLALKVIAHHSWAQNSWTRNVWASAIAQLVLHHTLRLAVSEGLRKAILLF